MLAVGRGPMVGGKKVMKLQGVVTRPLKTLYR
jgi:hypothetical protein